MPLRLNDAKNKIEAIGTICMQACGSACLAAQLKREVDLGSTPGIPDISPTRRLFERRTKQTRANINKVRKHMN